MLNIRARHTLADLIPTHGLDSHPASTEIERAFWSTRLDGIAIECKNEAFIFITSNISGRFARLVGDSDATPKIAEHLKARGLVTRIMDDRAPAFTGVMPSRAMAA